MISEHCGRIILLWKESRNNSAYVSGAIIIFGEHTIKKRSILLKNAMAKFLVTNSSGESLMSKPPSYGLNRILMHRLNVLTRIIIFRLLRRPHHFVPPSNHHLPE